MFSKSSCIFKKFKRYGCIQPAMIIFGIPVPNNVKIFDKITIPEHNIDFIAASEGIEFDCHQLLGDGIWGPFQSDDFNESVIPGTFPQPKFDTDFCELDNISDHDVDKVIKYNESLNSQNYGTTNSTIKDFYGYYVFGLRDFHKKKE